MLCDYHVRTAYSDDSDYPMEDVVKNAIALGINELCFTDHVDYGIKTDLETEHRLGKKDLYNVDYPKYMNEIQYLQQKYSEEIVIKAGMEFGMQVHTIPQFQRLYDQYDFDFIILSCHQVEDKEFWTQDFQREKTQQEYNERYYQEIFDVIQQYNDYSVLGHLDLIRRYDAQGEYPFERVRPIITEILKKVIADGKGIEVNTSSHRYELNDLTPSREILRIYKELGGRIITIGSDSHEKEHLGAYINETKEELHKLGFTEFCTFKKMKPIYHPL